MTKNQKSKILIDKLKSIYPDPSCSLIYDKSKPYELLIATRLSAQCTDKRVNIVTGPMFNKLNSLELLAKADVSEIEEFIKSCGCYKIKARDISSLSKDLIEKFNSVVPDNMEDLLSLSGIGRKTANLILGDIYNKPAIVTDTHCIRITNRLGLTTSTNPLKVENELRLLLPETESNNLCHRLVLFGRDICTARSPKCNICVMNFYCNYDNKPTHMKGE